MTRITTEQRVMCRVETAQVLSLKARVAAETTVRVRTGEVVTLGD